ncbi:MAG: hypothetical protein ACKO8O_13325 [Betaproteobacteria bacterium]
MKSVKSFFGVGQHKPIPGPKPNFKDSVAEIFSRIGLTPKLGTSISILDRAKNFLSRFNLGREKAKHRTSEPGENLRSGHIKQSSKAKPKENVESLLFDSGSSSKPREGGLKNAGSLIPDSYQEK